MERMMLELKDKDLIFDSLKKQIAHFACLTGMRAPVPDWFKRLPLPVRFTWRALVIYAEMTLSIMIISYAVMLRNIGSDFIENIADVCESMSGYTFLITSVGKTIVMVREKEVVRQSLEEIRLIDLSLAKNPIKNNDYHKFYRNKLRRTRLYSSMRYYLTMFGFFFNLCNGMFRGLIWPAEDSALPMSGWFPIDRTNRFQFGATSLVIFSYYTLCASRDIYCDMYVHLVFATVNAQIVYLRTLLDDITKLPDNREQCLHWWIKTHQRVLKLLEDLKPTYRPQLTLALAGNIFIQFVNLIRATEDKNLVPAQILVIMSFSFFILVHLYLVCVIGDEITDNMEHIADAVENKELWDMTTNEKKLVYMISIYSTKPYIINFAGNTALLHSEPYSDMVFKMLGYFQTVYQLRQGS